MRTQLIAVVVAALAVLPLDAGIRSNEKRVDRLYIGGASYGIRWQISYPYLRNNPGYLAYDVTGKSPKVFFSKEKGSTRAGSS